MKPKVLIAAAACAFSCVRAVGAAEVLPTTEVIELPLEELLNIEVTSPGKRSQRIGDTASAIFVLSSEDIARSGATTIPDLLRLIPGLNVGQINAHTWAISARGFNSRFANKLLVMVDGRTIYSPLFSGVFWDRQDTHIEDIDRIEVIRGPGATMWGANAVNGVINILTKSSHDTQGGLLVGALRNVDEAYVSMRHGTALGNNSSVRIYAKYIDRDAQETSVGADGGDQWRFGRIGFRADGAPDDSNAWMVQGDIYDGHVGEAFISPSFSPPFAISARTRNEAYGAYILGNWRHRFSSTSELTVAAYYSHSHFSDPRVSETRDTIDASIEHVVKLGTRHDVVWGGGYRRSRDTLAGTPNLFFTPPSATTSLVNVFVQDTVTVLAGSVFLTVGSKAEYNTYTDFELQPSARILWTPNNDHSLWAAISRAVRTPSRAEEDVSLVQAVLPPFSPRNPSPLPLGFQLNGTHTLGSERLTAYEVGYRTQLTSTVSLDATAFYNVYRRLASFTPGPPTVLAPPPRLVSEFAVSNDGHGHTQGTEIFASWRVTPRWRLQGSATFLEMRVSSATTAATNPRQQYQVRSMFDVGRGLMFDLDWRWVGSLPALAVESYSELNARLAWRITPTLEAAVIGENLLHARHFEFGSETLPTVPTQVPRTITVKIATRF